MVVLGLAFYVLGKRSSEDYFIAGRGLPWWLPSSSVYATHTATDTPIWMAGAIYVMGVKGLWLGFFSAWAAISAFVSTKIFRRSMAYTHAEYQRQRFGGRPGEMLRGWFAGWQVFMQMFVLGWVGIAMGRVAAIVFGWPDWVGLILFSSLAAVYTMAAGYWGTIIADFQQSVIAFIVIVLVTVWGLAAVGGPQGLVDRLEAMGRADMLDPFGFTGAFSGDFSVFWFVTILVVAIVGGIGMATSIDWYPEAQRIQSTRTVRDATLAVWTGSVFILIRNAIWAVPMLAFVVLSPGITDVQTYELAWYRIGFDTFPVGMIGFFLAAIIAIHFSTVSSSLNLGAMYATRDLYHHYINPKATDKQLVRVGRIMTVVVLLGSFVYGSIITSITQWLIFALWVMVAGVWLPNILQVVWWRVNGTAYLTSSIVNLGLSWLVVWILPAIGVLPDLSDNLALQFWSLLILSTLVFIPVTLLTKPEKMDLLVEFYDSARPLGWWGPVRREWLRRQGVAEGTGAQEATA